MKKQHRSYTIIATGPIPLCKNSVGLKQSQPQVLYHYEKKLQVLNNHSHRSYTTMKKSTGPKQSSPQVLYHHRSYAILPRYFLLTQTPMILIRSIFTLYIDKACAILIKRQKCFSAEFCRTGTEIKLRFGRAWLASCLYRIWK